MEKKAKRKRLLLLRHAATDAGSAGQMVGVTDVPASKTALVQLRLLQAALSPYTVDNWLCSPMMRARQTAHELEKVLSFPEVPIIEPRLQEIDFGRWEMKTFADIMAKDQDKKLVERWKDDFENFCFPGGESVKDFCGRIKELLLEIQETDENKNILLITHGGVIRAMICLALGLPLKNYLLFHVKPAKLCVLDLYSKGAVLAGFNL